MSITLDKVRLPPHMIFRLELLDLEVVFVFLLELLSIPLSFRNSLLSYSLAAFFMHASAYASPFLVVASASTPLGT